MRQIMIHDTLSGDPEPFFGGKALKVWAEILAGTTRECSDFFSGCATSINNKVALEEKLKLNFFPINEFLVLYLHIYMNIIITKR